MAVAGLILLVAVSYFAYAALWSTLRQWQAYSSFVPVTATVVEASVQSRGSNAATHGQSYLPQLVYQYSIGGNVYRSNRYFFTGEGWSSRAAVEAALAQFVVGSPIQAYVDAGDPQQAVIDRSRPAPGMLLYLLPLAVLAFIAIVYGLRRRR